MHRSWICGPISSPDFLSAFVRFTFVMSIYRVYNDPLHFSKPHTKFQLKIKPFYSQKKLQQLNVWLRWTMRALYSWIYWSSNIYDFFCRTFDSMMKKNAKTFYASFFVGFYCNVTFSCFAMDNLSSLNIFIGLQLAYCVYCVMWNYYLNSYMARQMLICFFSSRYLQFEFSFFSCVFSLHDGKFLNYGYLELRVFHFFFILYSFDAVKISAWHIFLFLVLVIKWLNNLFFMFRYFTVSLP